MRKESEQFADGTILEGMVSIRALIHAKDDGINDRPIRTVYFDPEKKKIIKDLGYLRAKSREYGFEVLPATAEDLEKMAVGNTHGGLIAVCGERKYPALQDATSLTDRGFYALIDGIEDPYNFGYAIRSLYAAGVDGIILSERNWLSAAGVVARASAGASERLPFYIASPEDAVPFFRHHGYLTVAADLRTEHELGLTPLPLPLLLVAGGEKRGISKAVLDEVELRVKIPYGRQFFESLSAASAVTMFAYEILRQNRK